MIVELLLIIFSLFVLVRIVEGFHKGKNKFKKHVYKEDALLKDITENHKDYD